MLEKAILPIAEQMYIMYVLCIMYIMYVNTYYHSVEKRITYSKLLCSIG